jgi:hypothetical protein
MDASWRLDADGTHLLAVYLPVTNVAGERVAAVLGLERSDLRASISQAAMLERVATVSIAVVMAIGFGVLVAGPPTGARIDARRCNGARREKRLSRSRSPLQTLMNARPMTTPRNVARRQEGKPPRGLEPLT